MIDNLLYKLKLVRQNSIAKNIFALGFLQLTNYLLPLLFIPYLIRVIGLERFGQVSFSQAVMILLTVLTDYGFNLISTREISLNRNDPKKLSSIYSTALSSKMFLGLVTLIIICVCIALIPKLNEQAPLHLFAISLVLGQTFFPVWLFQGLEKMQYITYLNLFSKIFTLLCVIIFITSKDDFIYVLPCYGGGSMLSSIASIYIIKRHFKLEFTWQKGSTIVKSLREGFPVFASNISVALYSSTTLIILSAFTNDITVGYYSAAEKIMLVPRQILGVFSQAIYPRVCQLSLEGYEGLVKLWKKLFPTFLVMIFIFCLLIFLFAGQLSLLMIGSKSKEVELLIKMLTFIPLIVALNIPSYLTLLAYNLKVRCLKVLIFASVFNMLLNSILSYNFGAMGTATALILTEAIISLGLFIMLKKSKSLILNKPYHGII